MHLVLDVGNTETVIALFVPGEEGVAGRWRVSTHVPRTPDEYVLMLGALLRSDGHDPDALTRVVLGSVVPSASDVEEPRTVGADRIANTMAASRLFGRDCIVVDLGTATTYDCISADGRFQGGVIAPGLMSGKEWLAARTAKLPPVEFIRPERVIGKRTESCIHSGIFFTTMDAIAGMIERVRAEWDVPHPMVVGTGGFSPLVARHVAAFDHVDPLLTLIGLELAGKYMVDDHDPEPIP